MNLLIVEDNVSFAESLSALFGTLTPPPHLFICRSRDSALKMIGEQSFDLGILDRKIPTADDELDSEVEHGRAVYDHLRATQPGVPICIVTGFGDPEFLTGSILDAQRADIWGSGTMAPMLRVFLKSELSSLEAVMREVVTEERNCSAVELYSPVAMTYAEKKVFRIFARMKGSSSVQISKLTPGLSGMRVVKAAFSNERGAPMHTCVARIGSHEEVQKEIVGYWRDITRLPNGSYAGHSGEVRCGAADRAGVFYSLIPTLKSLLTVLQTDEQGAVATVRLLRANFRSWTGQHSKERTTIGQIRRGLINNSQLAAARSDLDGVEWTRLEHVEVSVHLTAQHRDLHAENVLVGSNKEPVLIDFGSVGMGPSCLDPLTLELALLFHPDCKRVVGDWPSPDHAKRWNTIEDYVAACPYKDFVREVRLWAEEEAGGKRALYGTVYAIALRQLKFPGTDRRLVRALCQMAISMVEQDT